MDSTGRPVKQRGNIYERAHKRVTQGDHPRLMEAVWFGVPGLVTIVLAVVLWRVEAVSTPIAFLIGIVGVVYAGFGLLPPVPEPASPPKNPKSRRR